MGHQEGRDGRHGQGQERQRRGGCGSAEPDQQQPRPHQVELLLDRQRPQVIERQRARRSGRSTSRVRRSSTSWRSRSAAETTCRRTWSSWEASNTATQTLTTTSIRNSAGQQAAGAPQPELARAPTFPYRSPVAEQQVGDQVTGQREEHADPEQPPWRPGDVQVVGDHAQDGHCAHPVQARHVAVAGLCRFGHRLRESSSTPPASAPPRRARLDPRVTGRQ